MRFVVPTEKVPTSEEIRETEENMKRETGRPIRIIALNPKEIKEAKLTWVVTVNPREKRSSEASKLMFRAEVQDAIALGLQLKQSYIQERFAEVWGDDPSKMFEQGQPATPGGTVTPPAGGSATPVLQRPKIAASEEPAVTAPGAV